MKIYLLVFIATLLIQLIPIRNDREYLRRVILTFIPMFLFGALRVDFGLDYGTYEDEFYRAQSYSNFDDISTHSEIGYIILEKIVPSWRLLLILTSALTCIAYANVFYKCIPPKYSWLAVCLLFLAGDKTIFFQFSGIRNAIAIAIMYLSFDLIRDRTWFKMAMITIFAMSFHTSAVLVIPLVFLLCHGNDMSKREAVIWIAAMIVMQVISLNGVFDIVSKYVGIYMDRYSGYAEKIAGIGDSRSILIRGVTVIFISLIVWFMLTTKLSKEENVLCRIALLFIFAELFGALNYRMYQFLGFAFVCGSTIIFSKWQNSGCRYAYFSFTLLYLGYSFFIVWLNRPDFPYQIYHSILG